MLLNKEIDTPSKDNPDVIEGSRFAEALYQQAKQNKFFEVSINCPGGNVVQSTNIFNAILDLNLDTVGSGVAASSGGWLLLAGNKVKMYDYGVFMCHNSHGGDGTDEFNHSIATMLAARTGRNGKPQKTVDEMKALMNKTTFMTAQECLDEGLIDEIIPTPTANKALFNIAADATAKWHAANKIINSITTKNKTMTKVTNLLNLNESANEEAIVSEINKLKNSLSEITAKNAADCKNIEALRKERDEMENKLKEAENRLAEAEEEKKEGEIKNILAKYENRIGKDEDVVNNFVTMGLAIGADKLKNHLDKMPHNTTAARFDIGNNGAASKGAGKQMNAANEMAKIAAKLAEKNKK